MAIQTSTTVFGSVSCRIGHHEISHAEALNTEGHESMQYFCGSGCYDPWRHDKGNLPRSKSRGADNP
jgi:hypothetical protein